MSNVLEITLTTVQGCKATLKMAGKHNNPQGEFLSPYHAIQWASAIVGCANFITVYVDEEEG